MVMMFADASFLVSAFVGDRNGVAAWRWWRRQKLAPLLVSRMALFEAENTIRCGEWDGRWDKTRAEQALAGLHRARLEGLIERREVSNRRVYPAAQRLSLCHTGPETYGAMDIVHVASAQELKATHFVSFDQPQRRLAKAEGMRACP